MQSGLFLNAPLARLPGQEAYDCSRASRSLGQSESLGPNLPRPGERPPADLRDLLQEPKLMSVRVAAG